MNIVLLVEVMRLMVVVILVLVVRMRVVVVITGRPTGVQIGSVGSNGPAAAALQVLLKNPKK